MLNIHKYSNVSSESLTNLVKQRTDYDLHFNYTTYHPKFLFPYSTLKGHNGYKLTQKVSGNKGSTKYISSTLIKYTHTFQ